MNKKEWDLMLQEGEGYNLEFKESISDSTAKEMCAFANANGGKILMGVSDTGETKGIPITNRLKSQIYDSSKWVHTPQLAANRNFLRLKNTPQLAAVGIFYLLSQTSFIQVENSTSTHLFLLSCAVSVPLTGTMSSFMFAGRKEKVIPSISASASQFSVEAYIFPKV